MQHFSLPATSTYFFDSLYTHTIRITHNHTTCLCSGITKTVEWVQALQSALLVAQVAMQMSSERLSVPPIWWVTKGTQEPWVATAWHVSSKKFNPKKVIIRCISKIHLHPLEPSISMSKVDARTRSLAAMSTLACGAWLAHSAWKSAMSNWGIFAA